LELQAPDYKIALLNNPLARGDTDNIHVEIPALLTPAIVILFLSPPKYSIY